MRRWIILGVTFVVVLLLGGGGFTIVQVRAGQQAEQTAVSERLTAELQATAIMGTAIAGLNTTLTVLAASPTPTATPHPTNTPLPTPTPTGAYEAGTIAVSPIDGMLMAYIPPGEFLMGSSSEDPYAFDFEKPQHTIYLDGYWIDQTPVTNLMYDVCVKAGVCPEPVHNATDNIYYGYPVNHHHPVIYVNWFDAVTYCEWAGRRLPTEAEWEKAARGVDGRLFPWGNNDPYSELANFNNIIGYTTIVGEYPDGASPYGVLDMVGNVREWVHDWYAEDYYQYSPSVNPQGPDTGEGRVLKGGSFTDELSNSRAATRFLHDPNSAGINRGFRCALSQ
jgi:formylglycine-generating enzyme required for sulfatase activity